MAAPTQVFRYGLPQAALLYGSPASYAPGSSPSTVTNWPNSSHSPLFAPPSTGAGTITVPIAGLYRMNFLLVFTQGNTNKELAIIAWLRSTVKGDLPMWSQLVSDDKTDVRSCIAVATMPFDAGEVLSTGLSWINEGIGTITFSDSTFELGLVYF